MKRHPLIMVVDDDREILIMVRRFLELEGYGVITVSSGDAALAMLAEHEPALILLDVMMPGLDGFQVLKLVRERSDVPVIMLTAWRDTSCVEKTLLAGADDYVTKPFSTSQLIARIRAKLRRADAGDMKFRESPALRQIQQHQPPSRFRRAPDYCI